jgi:acyl-CoA synthetase (AMP-forming)/AMP-acid ligase II
VNLTENISAVAALDPERPAVVTPKVELRFAELDVRVRTIAAGLAAAGIAPGQVVGARISDELTALFALLACARLGAALYSVPTTEAVSVRVDEMVRLGIDTLLTDLEPPEDGPLRRLRPEGSAGGQSIDAGSPAGRAETPVHPDPDAAWLISSSSGTTGRPKLTRLTHRHLLERMRSNNAALGLGPGDRVAMMSTLDFPTPKQRYLEALCAGATVVLFDRSNPMTIAALGVTVLHCTPMHAEFLLRPIERREAPPGRKLFPGLRALCLSTASVSNSLRERVRARLTEHVRVRYGANETSFMTTTSGDDVFIEGAVGRPQPGVSLRIVDPLSGRDLPTGETGLILARSPGMIDGYHLDEGNAAHHFRAGWFVPGDLGRFTQDGVLVHCGRADQMMIFNGINIYPLDIENAAAAHPDVVDAVAFPLNHLVHQDVPCCAVALRAGSTATEAGIAAFLREALGMRGPRIVVALDRIPRNPNGKVLRPLLTGLVRSRLHERAGAGESPAG